MNTPDEIDTLATTLKDSQDKLLAYARSLESIIESIMSERTAEQELAKAKSSEEFDLSEKITQLASANVELRKQTSDLIKRNSEITLISKMNDFLQSCNTETEAYTIISETVTQLFPEDSGAVFVFNASRNMLEATAVWGPLPPAQLIFPPNECWALRRGQTHLAIGHEKRCSHVTDNGHMYVCVPLLAQSETLGILHLLDGLIKGDKAHEERMTEKCNLAKTLADNIGLSIANLKMRESMRNLSIRDPLTGLFNRRYMEEALAQGQHRAKRGGGQLAVIMIDIDHFKQFNDDFGHDGGDAILRALGTFLKKHVRESDIACRYGGEEFALILSPSTGDGAVQRAEKICEEVRFLSVKQAKHALGAITLSLGVAVFPEHGSEAAALVKAADLALYQAKRSGRNQVVMFTPETPHVALPDTSPSK